MSCQEFENLVNDLAGGRLWDAGKRARGLSHANSCTRCGARLANERLLSFELGALARQERKVQAPAQLKQDLLDTFAAQHGKPTAAVISFPGANRNRNWLLAIAAAALLALALVLPLRAWFGRSTPVQPEPVAASPAVAAPENATPVPVGPAKEQLSTEVTPTNDPRTVSAQRAGARRRTPHRTHGESSMASSREIAANREVTSGFIPLTYLNNATAAVDGVVLRVEVSRDKLAALGLPLNLERSGETIKADIIVGDDGVARAIRLVQ